MRVPLRILPQTVDIDLDSAFVGAAIGGMAIRDALERPADDPNAGKAHAHVELHGDDDGHVYGRGRLQGWLEVACSRCVGTARVPFNEALNVTFLPKDRMPAEEENEEAEEGEAEGELGVELAAEDLDVYAYEGEEIDLEPLLREQVILAVPFAPLCREDCKGLCPQCGIDRNFETCACEPPLDPRLAALKNVKL